MMFLCANILIPNTFFMFRCGNYNNAYIVFFFFCIFKNIHIHIATLSNENDYKVVLCMPVLHLQAFCGPAVHHYLCDMRYFYFK